MDIFERIKITDEDDLQPCPKSVSQLLIDSWLDKLNQEEKERVAGACEYILGVLKEKENE